jgi:hypothetical protein
MYDDLQFLISDQILQHCHSNYYNEVKFEQEVNGFSLVTFLKIFYFSMFV